MLADLPIGEPVPYRQGSFLMRGRQGEQSLLEPVRPGEEAIPLDLEVIDRSGLFDVVVHAINHLTNHACERSDLS